MKKKAVLLINLGTPDSPEPASVRRYLREFLNDPRVIDLPDFLRWALVNLFIIPFRYKKTSAAYQKIWGKGSPLLDISNKLRQNLADELGSDYQVELGMRYGQPSIASAINKFVDTDELTVIPLFPQYASASNGSAIEAALATIGKKWNIPAVKVINDFYQQSNFIAAFSSIIKQNIQDKKIDMLVFSYHGLPERHITKSECRAQCDHIHSCPVVEAANRFCYRAQCYATSEAIVKDVGLNSDQYVVSFQSRLGRTPWIKPYTDLILPELYKTGVRNIAIVSPSFVADCLETLEEINIRLREQWQALGGQEFVFIPCVNNHPLWIKSLAEMVR